MKVGTADREAMVAMSEGHSWSDIKPLNWGNSESRDVFGCL